MACVQINPGEGYYTQLLKEHVSVKMPLHGEETEAHMVLYGLAYVAIL